MAFVAKSALATGTTTLLPTYASATAGNLLVACVTADMATPKPFTITGTGAATGGWFQIPPGVLAVNVQAEIWWKVALGSDTMPTWNMAGTLAECIVSEFSSTVFLDQNGVTNGTTGPSTVTQRSKDGGTGRLMVCCGKYRASVATTSTFTDNICAQGVGTGVSVLGDNGATSAVAWHHSCYSTSATTGTSADTWVSTSSATTTHRTLVSASFSTAQNGAFIPALRLITRQTVTRAANW